MRAHDVLQVIVVHVRVSLGGSGVFMAKPFADTFQPCAALAIPLHRFGGILGNTIAQTIHPTEVVLGFCKTLLSGLAILLDSFDAVLVNEKC